MLKVKKYIACSFLPGIFILLFFISCKKRVDEPVDFQYDYYPVSIGSYWEYQVDSTVYNLAFAPTITYTYQIREVFESAYTDNENRNAIKIVRYYRKNNSEVWTVNRIWSTVKTVNFAERQEENIRTVKLRFPVKENLKWNANVYNNLGETNYTIIKVDQPYTIGGTSYAPTLTVNQLTDTNLISYKKYFEVYAKGIGMIYKEIDSVTSQNRITIPSVLDRIENGIICKIKLTSYGKL